MLFSPHVAGRDISRACGQRGLKMDRVFRIGAEVLVFIEWMGSGNKGNCVRASAPKNQRAVAIVKTLRRRLTRPSKIIG